MKYLYAEARWMPETSIYREGCYVCVLNAQTQEWEIVDGPYFTSKAAECALDRVASRLRCEDHFEEDYNNV